MHNSLKNDNRGVALVAVIMAMLVFTLLGVSALTMTTSNLKNGLKERNFQAAYYIAEAGANYSVETLKTKILGIYEKSSNEEEFYNEVNNLATESLVSDIAEEVSVVFEQQYGTQPYVNLAINTSYSGDSTEPLIVKIESKGTLDDISRTVINEMSVYWVEKETQSAYISYAIYAKTQLGIKKNATINGLIGIGPDAVVDDKRENKENLVREDENISFVMPNLPEKPSEPNVPYDNNNKLYTLSENINYIKNLNIDNHLEATIKYTENNNILIVDNISIGNRGDIKIECYEGSANLKVYVLNSFSNTNMGKIYGTNNERFEMYYYGDNVVKIGGNNFYFSGMVYAPNSEVQITTHGNFTGPIIATTVDIANHAIITYNNSSDYYEIPTSPTDPPISTDNIITNITPVREK